MTIKRILLIKCDACGAEGPCVEGEHRPALLQEAFALGWKDVAGQHRCMECVKPKPKATHVEVRPDGGTRVVEQDHDRSVHWTESRKQMGI